MRAFPQEVNLTVWCPSTVAVGVVGRALFSVQPDSWPWWWFFHLCSPSCSALPYPSISCLAAGIVLTPCTSQEGFLSLTADESLALAGGLWGLRHVTPCPCRCQLVGWAGPLLQNLPLHCHDSWFSQRGGKVCLFGPWKSSHFGAATSAALGWMSLRLELLKMCSLD